jgi:hypothetical protein
VNVTDIPIGAAAKVCHVHMSAHGIVPSSNSGITALRQVISMNPIMGRGEHARALHAQKVNRHFVGDEQLFLAPGSNWNVWHFGICGPLRAGQAGQHAAHVAQRTQHAGMGSLVGTSYSMFTQPW